jgi:hypothetical protein
VRDRGGDCDCGGGGGGGAVVVGRASLVTLGYFLYGVVVVVVGHDVDLARKAKQKEGLCKADVTRLDRGDHNLDIPAVVVVVGERRVGRFDLRDRDDY